MKAPIYQRAEALNVAIQTAVHILSDPIEGLQMTSDDGGIIAWSRSRSILMSYRYDNHCDPNGNPMPGSGNWSAQYVRDCAHPSGAGPAAGRLARMLGSFFRKRSAGN